MRKDNLGLLAVVFCAVLVGGTALVVPARHLRAGVALAQMTPLVVRHALSLGQSAARAGIVVARHAPELLEGDSAPRAPGDTRVRVCQREKARTTVCPRQSGVRVRILHPTVRFIPVDVTG